MWYDAGSSGLETTPGTSFFPFRRAAGGVINIGTGSPQSVCRADSSVWWVGLDGIVYRSNGYNPQRVSTHAVEAIIGGDTVGLVAVTHPYRGHWFGRRDHGWTTGRWCMTWLPATGMNARPAPNGVPGYGRRPFTPPPDFNSLHLYRRPRDWLALHARDGRRTTPISSLLREAIAAAAVGQHQSRILRPRRDRAGGWGADTPGTVVLEWSDDGSRT